MLTLVWYLPRNEADGVGRRFESADKLGSCGDVCRVVTTISVSRNSQIKKNIFKNQIPKEFVPREGANGFTLITWLVAVVGWFR
jgi:hypothetical protein